MITRSGLTRTSASTSPSRSMKRGGRSGSGGARTARPAGVTCPNGPSGLVERDIGESRVPGATVDAGAEGHHQAERAALDRQCQRHQAAQYEGRPGDDAPEQRLTQGGAFRASRAGRSRCGSG